MASGCQLNWKAQVQGEEVEINRQEYWSGVPFSPPGDLLDPGIEPTSLTSPLSAGDFFTTSTTWEACCNIYIYQIITCILNLHNVICQ